MKSLLQLIVACALVIAALLLIAPNLAQEASELGSPVHLVIFALVLVVYLVPTAIAMYRNCAATGRIILLNLMLGWTVIGWAGALGWALCGKTKFPRARPQGPAHGNRPVYRN